MKKIYQIHLMDGWGELWLDENLNLLKYISAMRAEFDETYFSFIFNHLGVELVTIELNIHKKEVYPLVKAGNSPEKTFEVLKERILRALDESGNI